MASLRVFVSSTCYDLSSIRSHLRQFIIGMGHQPIMSEYNDVLYDPRTHTHTSCIEEINNADYIVLIIGGRFGGTVVPDALSKIDFDELKNKSKSSKLFETKSKSSITQMEIFKAIEKEIPIITFVDSRVMNDHATYEKNKLKEISQHIEYASIEKAHTSSFIFEFINFLRLRSNNNTIHTFSRPEEIENTLRGQWSALLQRLLNDEKTKITERKGMEDFSTRIEDLKTAILASIGGSKLDKETARGIVIYRKFIDFLRGFKLSTYDFLFEENAGSKTLLDYLNISNVIRIDHAGRTNGNKYGLNPLRPLIVLLKSDGTFYLSTNLFDLDDMILDFNNFVKLPVEGRRIIFDTLYEMYTHIGILRRNFVYVQDKNIDDFLNEISENQETPNDGKDDE